MKKIALLALFTAASAFALACSGDDNNNSDAGKDSGLVDTGTDVSQNTDSGSDSGIPTPPTPGAQIDRMGRPAINTALNHVFDTTSGKGPAKDAYNADKAINGWSAAYGPEFAKNLAIFDALDTVCGNQAAYSLGKPYAALAGLTADDQLYVDTSKSTCTTYLAVELNATKIQTNTDCGGRGLAFDVIDATYGAVSGAAPTVPDGIGPVAAKTNGTTFPYLAAPQ